MGIQVVSAPAGVQAQGRQYTPEQQAQFAQMTAAAVASDRRVGVTGPAHPGYVEIAGRMIPWWWLGAAAGAVLAAGAGIVWWATRGGK